MTEQFSDPEMAARGKARREELGLSPKDLSFRMNLTSNRVHQLETQGALSLTVIRKWAEALDMDAAELVFGVPEPKPAKKGKKR
jgi:transcriptional regulator with XRE-family HTH domain